MNLSTTTNGPLAEHNGEPVAVYLAGLAAGSRRTMLGALDTIAALATDGRADARSFPWQQLRHEHTAAIRAALAERYAMTTANKALAALRGVLKACWRLGLIDGETYQRAVDVPAVRGETLPRGRSLTAARGTLRLVVCVRPPLSSSSFLPHIAFKRLSLSWDGWPSGYQIWYQR